MVPDSIKAIRTAQDIQAHCSQVGLIVYSTYTQIWRMTLYSTSFIL